MNAKVCKQCGELKPLDQYRRYYGGRHGTYTMCKVCEKINSRAKYLISKGDDRTEADTIELGTIYDLWDAQRAAGLQPPRQDGGRKAPLTEHLTSMIEKYSKQAKAIKDIVDTDNVPADLSKWLTEPLTEDPDYYLDVTYEALKRAYRPVLRISENMEPIYDDTYANVLDKILTRFYDYEDEYYSKEN